MNNNSSTDKKSSPPLRLTQDEYNALARKSPIYAAALPELVKFGEVLVCDGVDT